MHLFLFISNIGNHIDVNVRNRNARNRICRRILTLSMHNYIRCHYVSTPTTSTASYITINSGIRRII